MNEQFVAADYDTSVGKTVKYALYICIIPPPGDQSLPVCTYKTVKCVDTVTQTRIV